MVTAFRKQLDDDSEDLADFDSAIAAAKGAQYGVAAGFLLARGGPELLNSAIRLSVLRARTPRLKTLDRSLLHDVAALGDLEKDVRGWAIPQGTQGLAKFVAYLEPKRRGAILTTNFDPLLEVALQTSGLVPLPNNLDGVGAPQTAPRALDTLVQVDHVHGYWRFGDTLHTPAQLDRPRPQLEGYVRKVLSASIVCVIGYSGWDDVLTRSLRRLIEEGLERDVEVLWAHYQDHPETVAIDTSIAPGRIQNYFGVNANTLFTELNSALDRRIARKIPLRKAPPMTTIAGMVSVSDQFIARELSRDSAASDAIAFFDGRDPTWSDIALGRTARLKWAATLQGWLDAAGQGTQHLLLVGPTGEGKTTALMQAAWAVGEKGTFLPYFCDGAEVSVESVLNIAPTGTPLLLCVDNADLRVPELAKLIESLRAKARTDVHLLMSARDTDWRIALSKSHTARDFSAVKVIQTGSISEDDAKDLVNLWSVFGSDALAELKDVAKEERASRLHQASLGIEGSSLLGALLWSRRGADLSDHVRQLMARLSRTPLPTDSNLLRAFALICSAQTVGLSSLSIDSLGVALQLSRPETLRLVVDRLGREAATHRAAEQVSPRHPEIAKAVCALLPEFGFSRIELLSDLVHRTVATKCGQVWDQEVVSIAYLSQTLQNGREAAHLAAVAVAADPQQLRLRCAQIGVLRAHGDIAAAVEVAADSWQFAESCTDSRIAFRPYLREYSRAVGIQGNLHLSAVLNAISLVDLPEVDDISALACARGLLGMSFSLSHLDHRTAPDVAIWRGLSAEYAKILLPTSETELRKQADKYLTAAAAAGYLGNRSTPKNDYDNLRNMVRFTLNHSSLNEAKRFRAQSGELKSLGRHILGDL